MKMIRKIALAELRYLFYSPIAWFVILAFYILNAAFFFEWMIRMASALDAGKEAMDNFLGWMSGITKSMHFDVTKPFFKYLHLFIALLTMGVVSREINTGSIKLLYSSPVRNREIIVGKYLGMVLFSFIFLLGTALLMFTAIAVIDVSCPPEFLAILLALFLLINTYAAIGLFFSCITNYQIVAAVFTFLLVYLLDSMWNFGQKYDFVRTVTHLLTTKYKYFEIATGLVSSKTLLYFVLMIVMFLLFAMIRLRSTRVASHWRSTVFQYVAVLVVVLTIGHLSSRPGWIFYKDLTSKQVNTLHPSTQEVLGKLDGSPLKVTLYVNLLQKFDKFGFPEQRFVYMSAWDQYLRFYPNIQFDYVYYYAIKDGDSILYKQYPGKNVDEIAAIKTEIFGERRSLFKPATSLSNFHELEKEDFKTLMKVEYKNKHTLIRTIADGGAWPQQIHISGGLMRLIRDTNVAVTFLSGHLERSPFRNTGRDYGMLTSQRFEENSLVERGVDVDTISVRENEVPKDVQVLVIADPKVEYSPVELERIDQYIERGGNAIIFAEPGKQLILNPILNKLGVVVEDGVLIQSGHLKHLVTGTKTTKSLTMSRELERFLLFPALGNQQLHDVAAMLSYKPVAGFEVEPIIVATKDKKIWLKKGAYVRDSIAPAFNKEEGDLQLDEYTIAVALTRKIAGKEQRIIIAGDADFMSNKGVDRKKLNHHYYSWTLNNTYPVYAYYPFGDDRFLKLNRDQVEYMMVIYVYVIPVIIFFTAFILLMRRRKK
jgi:ABC-2 type transport system permease protein